MVALAVRAERRSGVRRETIRMNEINRKPAYTVTELASARQHQSDAKRCAHHEPASAGEPVVGGGPVGSALNKAHLDVQGRWWLLFRLLPEARFGSLVLGLVLARFVGSFWLISG
jgi:hypothetical protein